MGDAIQNSPLWDMPRPSALGSLVEDSAWMKWTGANNTAAVVAKNERFYKVDGRWLDEDTIYWTGPNQDESSSGNMTVMTAMVNLNDGSLSDIVDEGAPDNRPQAGMNYSSHCTLAGIDVAARMEASSSDLYVRGDMADGASGSLMAVGTSGSGVEEGNIVGTFTASVVVRHNGNGVALIYLDGTDLKVVTFTMSATPTFTAGVPATLYSSEAFDAIAGVMLTKDNTFVAWINSSTGAVSAGVVKCAAGAEVAGAKKTLAADGETTLSGRRGLRVVRLSATRVAVVYVSLGGGLRIAVCDVNLTTRTITAPDQTFKITDDALLTGGAHDVVLVDPVNGVLVVGYVKGSNGQVYSKAVTVTDRNRLRVGNEVTIFSSSTANSVALMKHPALNIIAAFFCKTGASDTQFRLLKP